MCKARAASCANGTRRPVRYVDADKVVKFMKFVILILSWIDPTNVLREYIGKATLEFIE